MIGAYLKQASSARSWTSLVAFFLTVGLTAITLSGQSQAVLRNSDIVTMATAHLSAETIVLKIETTPGQFDTSPDALAVLKAAGVPDAAIDAMIRASAPTATSPTPPSTTSSRTAATLDEGGAKATVYIYRPGKFVGKALEPSVFLDEQKLLDMDNARYLALKIAPGRHILRSNEKNSEIDQMWDGGQTYYIKLTIAAGMMKGRGQMGMVTEKLALKEMQRLRPLDKDKIEPDYRAIVDLTPLK